MFSFCYFVQFYFFSTLCFSQSFPLTNFSSRLDFPFLFFYFFLIFSLFEYFLENEMILSSARVKVGREWGIGSEYISKCVGCFVMKFNCVSYHKRP